MIKDRGKHLFDMIIVWKLSRFARSRYKTRLKKNGVKVVSATEVISDGAEGPLRCLRMKLFWFKNVYI